MKRSTGGGAASGDNVEQAPRFGWVIALLVYLLASFSLWYPALAGRFLAGENSDQYIAGYAFREFAASTLRDTGSFPLWNPYLFGGMPFIAAMHGDIFYPTFLLRLIMPTDVAMTWGMIGHVVLAGLFTYLFLRVLGFGFYSSLFGGLAYMMSGQIASLVSPGHDGKIFVSALFPLGLLFLTRGLRDGRHWSWGAFALVVGLAVLSPHPQLLQYMLLASGAYGLFLTVGAVRRHSLAARSAAARVALAFAAVIVGGLIGAVQYLPVREYVAWSPRSGGLPSYEQATSYAWPATELLNAYLPQFSGILNWYWGENGIHFHSDYVGVVIMMVAGAAFIGLRGSERRGLVWFWAGTLVVALLWALGNDTPFYRIPYSLVPGTKYFRAPNTVFFVGTLALSVLSAAGLERILRRAVGRRYVYGWLGVGAFITLLASTGMLTSVAQGFATEQLVDKVVANSLNVIIGAWRSMAAVVLTAAVLLFAAKARFRPAVTAMALLILCTIDMWSILRHYWMFSQPASRVYASNAAIDHVKNQRQPARVLAFQAMMAPSRVPVLTGDALMSHRVRNVLGYHGNQLGRYNVLLDKDQNFQQAFNPRMWAILNTQFLLTNAGDVANLIPGVQLVRGPVADASGTELFLYRVPGENPYAWVTPIRVKAPDDAVAATLLHPRFDARRVALFAEDASVSAVANVSVLPEPLDIRAGIRQYTPGKVAIELSKPAPSGSALVVSENYYPGWIARVDGREVQPQRADFILIGVPLEAGAKRIDLEFTSPSYETGKRITLAALLVSTLALVGGFVLGRWPRG